MAAATAAGYRVALRPAGDSPVIVIAGLDADGPHRLTADGFPPIAVTAAGGASTAWVRLARPSIAPDLASRIERDLTARYGHTPHPPSTSWGGTLAGLPGVTLTGPIRPDALVSPAASERLIATVGERLARETIRGTTDNRQSTEPRQAAPDTAQPRPRPQPTRADR